MQRPSKPNQQYPQQWQPPAQPLSPEQQQQTQPPQGQWQLSSQPMPSTPLQPQYPYYEPPEPQYVPPPEPQLAPKKQKLLKNKRFRIHYFYVVLIIGIVSGFINYRFAAVAIFGFLLGLLFHLWMKQKYSSSTPTSSTTPVATQPTQQPTPPPAKSTPKPT